MSHLIVFLTASVLGYAYAAIVVYAAWVAVRYYYTNKRD